MATIFLGTEKLQLQLEDGIGGEERSPSQQFFRFAILSDLMVDNIPETARRLGRVLKDQKFLLQVFGRKLIEIAIRFRLPEPQLDNVRGLVADIVSHAPPKRLASRSRHEKAKKGDQIAHSKSRIIEGLQRQRLRIELEKKVKVVSATAQDWASVFDTPL